MKKKILSVVLSLVMMVAFMPTMAFTSFAAEDVMLSGGVNVASTSDVHASINSLDEWEQNIKAKGYNIKKMMFCGDYSYSSGQQYVNDFKSIVEKTNNNFGSGSGAYTSGNHDYQSGGSGYGSSSIADEILKTPGFMVLGEISKTDAYIVYAFSTDSSNGTGDFSQDEIDTLDNYLKTAPTDRPIFILSHYPLHYIGGNFGGRTITNADKVIDVLNKYPQTVFLWGHNHSQSSETHYGEVKVKGNSIDYKSGSSKTINFTYANAGGMYDGSSYKGNPNYRGMVANIKDNGSKDVLTFAYYNLVGEQTTAYVTASIDGSETPVTPVTPGGDDPETPTGDISVTPSTDNPTENASIKAGETLAVKVTNGSTRSAYNFTTTSSNTGVASVTENATVNIAAGETKTVLIKGLSAGTSTITIKNDQSSSSYVRKATINLTVTSGGDDPVVPTTETEYVKASKFEIGKSYLIVNTDSGLGKALANNSDTFSTVNVTVAGDKITVKDSDVSKAVWEAKETGTTAGLIGLYNGSNVLKINAQSSPKITTSGTSYNAGGFGYTADNHISYPYGSNPKDYYIGSDSSNYFKASDTETGLGKVYIFEKGAAVPVDPTEDIDKAKEAAKAAIDEAAEGNTSEAVTKAVTDAKAAVDAAETVEAVTAAQTAWVLAVKKAVAVDTITKAAGDDPSEAVQAVLAAQIEIINKAEKAEDIAALVETAKAEIEKQVLADAVAKAVDELKALAGENPSKEIQDILDAEIAKIQAAATLDELQTLKEAAVKTVEEALGTDELAQARKEAIAALEALVADSDSAIVKEILAKAIEEINKADTPDAVKEVKDKAIEDIDKQHDADLLEVEKNAAFEVIDKVNENIELKYRDKEQGQVAVLVYNCSKEVEKALTVADVRALVAEFNSEIAQIPTRMDYDNAAKIKVALKSVTAGKKQAKVKWTPKKNEFAGYVIAYKQSGKKWKYKTVKGASKASVTIKSLKKGKKYSFKVRGYKLFGETKVYGKYSKAISKKIK